MQTAEQRIELASLRMELRGIDAEIESLRRESRRYRKMNFGLDLFEIQLTALQDRRGVCATRVAELEQALNLRPSRRDRPLAWLLLPLSLWLHLRQARGARPLEESRPAPRAARERFVPAERERLAVS